jgi:hypothetical protein
MFPIRFSVVAAILGFSGVFLPFSASAQSCNPTMPQISVLTPDVPVQYTDAYDVAYATGNKLNVEQSLPNGASLRGFAQTDPTYRISHSGSGGGMCYQPQQIQVVLSFRNPIRVAIDAHYYPNSCNYQAILDHENEHVAIAKSAVQNHVGEMTQAIQATAARALPYLGSTPNAMQVFSELVDASVQGVFQNILAEMQSRNAVLDSPESYRRTQDQCQGW